MKKVLGSLLLDRGINPGEYLHHTSGEGDPARCSMCGDWRWPRHLCRIADALLCNSCGVLWLLGAWTAGHAPSCLCRECRAWRILADTPPVRQLA